MPCRVFVSLILVAAILSQAAPAEELCVAFWNVENLFDTVDDPDVKGDEEFTPGSPAGWTPKRLHTKLANLARVLCKMNDGRGPDVLGLAEIENRQVVQLLVEKLEPLGRDYKIVHQDSPSDRGIDCALIYDSKRLSLRVSSFHFVDADNTRDIVEASFRCGNHTLRVFVNHWPSRSSNPEPARFEAARTLRRRLDEILKVDPQADVVLVGDFNDYPTNDSITVHLKTCDEPPKAKGDVFYNSMWPTHRAGGGTYVYQNKWEVIDHVIVSPGLLEKGGLRWKAGSTAPVLFDFQLFQPAYAGAIARPNRTYTGNAFHASGFSDHLPVACVLEF